MSFSIKEDIKEFLQDGAELYDATLVSSEGSLLPVHKFVLAMRSKYFKTAFFGELSSDTAKLHFEQDILEAIKKYCYTDSVGDIFDDYVYDLENGSGFLVRLAVAADYLLLPGLQRMLWEVAFEKMHYYVPCERSKSVIPAIYSEAKAMGAEELKVLAWHAYWMQQQKAEEYEGYKIIQTDVPFEDSLLPSDVNYKGLGMILNLGCSEDSVNGEYYGTNTNFPLYTSITEKFFKKNKDEAKSLSILLTADEEEPRSEDFYEIGCYLEEEEYRPVSQDKMYIASGWDSDKTEVFGQWRMNSDHKLKVGAKTGPTSFIFRI